MKGPKVWVTTDNHFDHPNIIKHGHRPGNHEELQIEAFQRQVNPQDIVFFLGDFCLGKPDNIRERLQQIPGRKMLVLGNHDSHVAYWYMNNGFDFAAEGILYRDVWMTHKPARWLPDGARVNLHGHLHDSDPQRHPHFVQPWHILLAIENQAYKPVELDRYLINAENKLMTTIEVM